MNTIQSYLDNMFASFPKTEAVLKLKRDLLENMEEKYNELKKEGRSENEAVGIVISEFGNIDELIKELGITADMPTDMSANSKPRRFVSDEEADKYLLLRKKFSNFIALGVFLCLTAVSVLVVLGSLIEYLVEQGRFIEISTEAQNNLPAIALLPFFVILAIAVAIFVFTGLRMEKFEYIEKEAIQISDKMKQKVEEMKEEYQIAFAMGITIGVILCVLAPAFLITIHILGGDQDVISGIGVAVLLMIISIAVWIFIKVGMRKDSFEQLLQEGDYAQEKKEGNKVIDAVAAVYWPLVVVVYLGWSFTSGNWAFTWIIWPLAGVAFGAFASLITILQKPSR